MADNMIRCPEGHFYDPAKHPGCPWCALPADTGGYEQKTRPVPPMPPPMPVPSVNRIRSSTSLPAPIHFSPNAAAFASLWVSEAHWAAADGLTAK